MLGFKKNGIVKMKSALDQIQSHLREYDEANAIEDYQKPIIPETETFKKFGVMVDQGHVSPYGGLLHYCNNAINVVKSGVESNKINVPIVIHIGEKMAHVALAMREHGYIDNFSDAEIALLTETEILAREWLALKERTRVLHDVEQRVNIVKQNLADKGVLEMVKNQKQFLEPILSWA